MSMTTYIRLQEKMKLDKLLSRGRSAHKEREPRVWAWVLHRIRDCAAIQYHLGMNLKSELGNFPVNSLLNLDTMCVGLVFISKL